MLRALSDLARHAVGLVYPNSCLVCDAPESETVAVRHGLCSDCRRAVGADPHSTCPRCAQTVGPHTDTVDGCGECRDAGFAFDRAVRLGPHAGRLRAAILRMKLPGGEGLADRMGQVLAEELRAVLATERVGLAVPVPLHWSRRWQRGFNQSDALARGLAAALDVPFAPHLLRRVRRSLQHAQPTRAARRANVTGVFRTRRGARLAGQTVLLVDDVMTTGSTLDAAGEVFRDAGASRVVVAVLARREGFR